MVLFTCGNVQPSTLQIVGHIYACIVAFSVDHYINNAECYRLKIINFSTHFFPQLIECYRPRFEPFLVRITQSHHIQSQF